MRCFGDGDPLYERYHDDEWGRPVRDKRGLFERFCLETFQSGLSWLTVLRKRDRFREVFHGFDPGAVAAFGGGEVAALLEDPGIIRNRAKIEATIANARALHAMRRTGESFGELVWSFAPPDRPAPRTLADIPSTSNEATALATALRRRGFRFVGPTTSYAAMQACGRVNDHLAGCPVRGDVQALRAGTR